MRFPLVVHPETVFVSTHPDVLVWRADGDRRNEAVLREWRLFGELVAPYLVQDDGHRVTGVVHPATGRSVRKFAAAAAALPHRNHLAGGWDVGLPVFALGQEGLVSPEVHVDRDGSGAPVRVYQLWFDAGVAGQVRAADTMGRWEQVSRVWWLETLRGRHLQAVGAPAQRS